MSALQPALPLVSGPAWGRSPILRPKGAVLASFALAIAAPGIGWSLFGPEASATIRSDAIAAEAAVSRAKQQDLLESTKGALAATLAEGEQARQINAGLPFSTAPVQAAAPFSLAGVEEETRARALKCLTQAIYYEAGYEPLEGRRAVAQVVLNRMRHPAFPKSVCGVVYEGSTQRVCQFSFTCDGSLGRKPSASAWAQAQAVASEALQGKVAPAIGQATHYHTDYVAPYWAPKLHKISQIGAHIFYRWPGAWGMKRAFTGRYAGIENLVSTSVTSVTSATGEDVLASGEAALPAERRAPNDVGGRLDTSKGWTLNIAAPSESRGRLAELLRAQEKSAPAVAATTDVLAAAGTGGTQ